MHPLIETIKKASDIVLTTHSQPDGDGLGCQFALYWALKKTGKRARVINAEPLPKKYQFLDKHDILEHSVYLKSPIKGDLTLVFDTNDPDQLPELWPKLISQTKQVAFVDHHVALERFPLDQDKHLINVNASSTGEIVFDLIKTLGIALDTPIAAALYTSIVFDTNYFKYIRGAPTPHLIAAELLRFPIESEKIHRNLFGNHSPAKLTYLGQILNKIEYDFEGRLACVRVHKADLDRLGLEAEETKDIVDLIMNIENIEAAVLFREEGENQFKISFRSKGIFNVSHLAQSLGGGGHKFASGATIHSTYDEIKSQVTLAFKKLFSI